MLKQQILIVDDEEINRVILRGLFEEEYEILEAENGQVATVQIENNSNIALILLDVVMPVIDATEGGAVIPGLQTMTFEKYLEEMVSV